MRSLALILRCISLSINASLGILISVCLVSNAYSQSDAEIKSIHIVTPAWQNVTNEDGTGLYFDILRNIYEPYGITVEYQIVPWKRAMLLISYHEADALPGGYYVPHDQADDLFPKYPIGIETLAAVSKKGKVNQWEGQKSISGKSVAWIRNYNYHKYLDVKVTWFEIDYDDQGWKMVDCDRVDFYMDNLNMVHKYIKSVKVDSNQYDVDVVASNPLFLRFANTPKSRKLIEIYDVRMPVLIEGGQVQRLFEKWNFPYPSFAPRSDE